MSGPSLTQRHSGVGGAFDRLGKEGGADADSAVITSARVTCTSWRGLPTRREGGNMQRSLVIPDPSPPLPLAVHRPHPQASCSRPGCSSSCSWPNPRTPTSPAGRDGWGEGEGQGWGGLQKLMLGPPPSSTIPSLPAYSHTSPPVSSLRAEALRNVESTIVELGTIFNKLGEMVAQQV